MERKRSKSEGYTECYIVSLYPMILIENQRSSDETDQIVGLRDVGVLDVIRDFVTCSSH